MSHLITPDSVILASDEEDEYLILDIYDQDILNKANVLDGLAIINFDSSNPTIVIGGHKHTAKSIPINENTPSSAIYHVAQDNNPDSAGINPTGDVVGVGHVSHHLVIGNPIENISANITTPTTSSQQPQQREQQRQSQQPAGTDVINSKPTASSSREKSSTGRRSSPQPNSNRMSSRSTSKPSK